MSRGTKLIRWVYYCNCNYCSLSSSSLEFKPAASGQVAFGLGDTSSPSIKTYGTRREVSSRKATALEIKDSSDDEGGIGSLALSPTIEDGTAPCSSDASAQKIKEDYIEPWVMNICIAPLSLSVSPRRAKIRFPHPTQDYVNTCYPTTLPWRKPFSGDPGMSSHVS